MSDLGFIKDEDLRKTLEDAIEFIYVLFKKAQDDAQEEMYQVETYRIIILYVVSAIEAILLYFYKNRGDKIESLEYKCVQALSLEFTHTQKVGLPVVIAVQEKTEVKEYDLGLHKLVNLFKEKKLIREQTAKDILDLNDVRNTFHFSKPRTKKCDVKRVENALKLLLHTIENAPKALKQG